MKTRIKTNFKIFCISLVIFFMRGNVANALFNEGLPASYGQWDIDEARIPDPTKRYALPAPVVIKKEIAVTTVNTPEIIVSAPTGTETIIETGPTVYTTLAGPPPRSSVFPTTCCTRAFTTRIPFGIIYERGPIVIAEVVLTPAAMNQMQQQDETITENIRTQIANDRSLASTTIIILTQNGVVTLSGTVDNENQKNRIEDIAKSIVGVKAINSRINVQSLVIVPNMTIYTSPTPTAPPPSNSSP